MPSLLSIIASLVVLYLTSFIYNFIRNFYHARKSGFSYFLVPWDQNHFVWMIISVPLRPILKRCLPHFIWERLCLTIAGFEFHAKKGLFENFVGPKEMNYVMVSMGAFEVSTRDPELVLEILRRTGDFQVHHLTGLFLNKFGRNVLTSDGEQWGRQRKVVATTLNERISKTVFDESIQQTQGLLEEVGESSTTKIFDGMKKITINVLTGAGMGSSVAWKDEENAKPKAGFTMSYIEKVKAIIEGVAGPIILPQWFFHSYPKFLPGYDMMHQLGAAIDEFPRHTWELMDNEKQRLQHAGSGGASRSNIISQILKANEEDSEKQGTRALSDEEMLGNLFVFTAAGFDTTANTLSYALVLLARHPAWQTWLFEELDSIVPSDAPVSEPDYSIFPKLTRVLAIMFETLRLYTPLVHLTRENHTPQTLTTSAGKTFWIPANATVYINTVALHLNEHVYRNVNLAAGETASATDESKFRPTRWIHTDPTTGKESLWTPPRGSFIPWSTGPRTCPGQKMAQVEFTSIFLTLFREKRIEAVKMRPDETRGELEHRLDERMRDSISILTLQMQDVYNVSEEKGIPVKLIRREKK